MTSFKAFRVYYENNQVRGRVETISLVDISSGDVLIRTAYSSINYKDALAVAGRGQIIRSFPRIPGIDVAGYIIESKDKRFKEGDAVIVTGYELGTAHDGGYAEYVRVPAEWVVPLPKTMSLFQAMAIGTAGFTVALCIKRLEENGQTPELGPFVVTGATGGVGCFAVDILASKGYKVIALTRKAEKTKMLRQLGAQAILEPCSIDLDSPSPLEKGEWGGAIDNVGGEILAWLIRKTKSWGNIASVGLAGGSRLNTTVMPFILRGVSVLGITSSGCPASMRQLLWNRLADDLTPPHLTQIVSRVVELTDLPGVFSDMLAGKTIGRTVVTINPL